MTLKVYADLTSQPCRAVVLFCRAAEIPHEFVQIQIKNGDHLKEDLVALNPLKTVPFAEHNGVVLLESMAILKYLSKAFNVEPKWYPDDLIGQQKVDEYLHWQHLNTRLSCAMYFQSKWLIPLMTSSPINDSEVSKFWVKMQKALDDMEQVWLKNGSKKYICNDQLSIADIVACCELEQPKMAGFDVRTDRPVLEKYMDGIKAELQPHYDDVHAMIYQISDAYKGSIPASKEELFTKMDQWLKN